jgi:hypothetical protein
MGIREMSARRRDMITADDRAAKIAAPRVQAQGILDMRTQRGNDPLFKGPMKGSTDIPFTVTAVGASLRFRGVKWALDKVYASGKIAGWSAIVRQARREAMKGKR